MAKKARGRKDKTRKRKSVHMSHDGWFLLLMLDPARVADFIRHHLPEEMVAQLDDSPPVPVPERYVTPALQQGASDRAFRLALKPGQGHSHILVVLEHQSTVDQNMALRTNADDAQLRRQMADLSKGKVPPPVILLVTYHGNEVWTAPQTLEDIPPVAGAIGAAQSKHKYVLCDLARKKECELAEDPVLRAGLLMMIHMYREGTTADDIARFLEPFPAGSPLEKPALSYIIGLPVSDEVLYDGVARAKSTRGVRILESMYDRAIREGEARGLARGEARGLARGEAKGQVKFLLKMLKRRFGDLPANVVSRVNKATPEQLDEWAEALLDVRQAKTLFRKWVDDGRSKAH